MKNTKINFITSVSIVIANMIGVGVFTSLGYQLIDLNDYRAILLIWIVGGFLALLGSFCYAELSSTFQKSGGEYHFLRISFGNYTGFLSGWTSAIVGFAAPIAAAAHAFAKYFTNVVQLDIDPIFISASLIIMITFIHAFSIKVGSRFQVYFTIGKVLLMISFIVTGFVLSKGGLPVTTENGPALIADDLLGQLKSQGFWIGLIFVSYAYSGWNASAYMIEDIKNPTKNVPRSILFGTIIVAILYTLINYVFLESTPADLLRGKTDVAHESATSLLGSSGALIISSLISFFLISSISSMIIVGPRVIKRISEDYTVFKFFAKETKNNIPQRSLLLQSIISLLILFTSSFEFIITSIGFILTIFTTLTAFAVIIMRFKEPGMHRPLKTPLYPLTPLIYCGFNLWILYFTFQEKPIHVLTGLGFLVVGSLCYFIISRRQKISAAVLLLFSMMILSCNQNKAVDEKKISENTSSREVIAVPQKDSVLDARASILAGLNNELLDVQTAAIASNMDSNWQRSYRDILLPIKNWSLNEGWASCKEGPCAIFYPFSGPDIAYAQQFFPDAKLYILAGLEPAGNEKSILFSDQPDYSSFIKNAERYFYFSRQMGFFRTADMSRQFSEKGVADILAFFLKKNNCAITDVKLKKWDVSKGDTVSLKQDEKADVCHISFTTTSNKSAQIIYFSKDLSDSNLKKDSLWLDWVTKKLENQNFKSLTKSASYLMHGSSFSKVRDFILKKSSLHIQDDSGIGFQYIRASGRKFDLYGKYTRTISLFSHSFNKDLAALYRTDLVKPLNFRIGYNIVHGESNLQVIQ